MPRPTKKWEAPWPRHPRDVAKERAALRDKASRPLYADYRLCYHYLGTMEPVVEGEARRDMWFDSSSKYLMLLGTPGMNEMARPISPGELPLLLCDPFFSQAVKVARTRGLL